MSKTTSSVSDGELAPSMSVHVVIIGAGIAGLAAADRLLGMKKSADNIKVTILEATSRVGGRIYSVPFGDGISEQGATWIHGIDGNPVYDCIAEQNITGKGKSATRAKGDDYCYANGLQPITASLVDDVESFYFRTIEECSNICQSENKGKDNQSRKESIGDHLKAAFDKFTEKSSETEQQQIADILRSCVNRECCYSGCDSVCDLMLRDYGEYQELGGDWPIFPKGYSQVTEALLKKLPEDCVVLNSPVKCVHWTQQGEELDSSKQPTSKKVKVECKDGRIFPADYIIVTVSLGILKENHLDMFHPPLPQEKRKSIERLGFGTVANISLQFDKPFWKSDHMDFIRLMWKDNIEYTVRKNPKQEWYKKLHCFYESPHNPNALICWLAGTEAQHMETLSEEEIVQSCTGILRSCYEGQSIPKPNAMLRTQWYSNPYFRGSYSYVPVGSEGCDIDILAEPIDVNGKPVILFAGEATHRSFYSTTHGAMLSGQREADRILHIIS